MRIGILGIQHESNTFMSVAATWEHFRAGFIGQGEEIRQHYGQSHHELNGFFDELDESRVQAVPVFFAWALPGGTIDQTTATLLLSRLQTALENSLPLDGLLVAPHGAAVSEPYRDFDGHWLAGLRDIVGPDVPIVGTLDLHANLSRKMVDSCDALVAYRTNPHVDQRRTGRVAARLLIKTLNRKIQPVQAAAFPSVTINIEAQATFERPCRGLLEVADGQSTRAGVLSNSVLLGFPYADVKEMGSSVVCVADGSHEIAEQCVAELREYLQVHRHEFAGILINVDSAIRTATDSASPVCLLDMGDNVGGGSPGDGTILLESLIRHRVDSAFVCLFDPESVEQCRVQGVGGKLDLRVGGKTDKRHGEPISIAATVVHLHDGIFHEREVRHGGRQEYNMGLTAVVHASTGQTIMLTSQRVAPFSLGQLTCCEINPQDFKVVVAKGVHAPVAAYRSVCPTMIRVNTPGITTADINSLSYQFRRRPLFPVDV